VLCLTSPPPLPSGVPKSHLSSPPPVHDFFCDDYGLLSKKTKNTEFCVRCINDLDLDLDT